MTINYFDKNFFARYTKEEEEVFGVYHKHIIEIIDTIVLWIFFGAVIPAFFYYNNSFGLKDLIPFLYFEIYLILIYIILLYKIFDWYNDVWIITDKGMIDLDWQFFKTNITYIDYNDMRGIEYKQNSAWDGIIDKGDIIIHTTSDNSNFVLQNAASPGKIVSYIQEIIDDNSKNKADEDQTAFDVLIGTLKKVVKDKLAEGGNDFYKLENDYQNQLSEEDFEKVLKKRGTIDLRVMEN